MKYIIFSIALISFPLLAKQNQTETGYSKYETVTFAATTGVIGFATGKGYLSTWVVAPMSVLLCVLATGHGPCGAHWTSCPCLQRTVIVTATALTVVAAALVTLLNTKLHS